MKSFNRYWYSHHPLSTLLRPFSYLYQIGIFFHRLTYDIGLKKKYDSPRPMIVIGNLTVGGTGKTPFTIELARILFSKGYKPGIVSRGYKGKAESYPQWVTEGSNPRLVGDEPVLMAMRTHCPIVVAPKRAEAIEMLLEKSDCDIILCDDGLQHHAIKKTLEIAIIDAERRFGNGWCLPAGPLREPVKRLSKVDFIIFHTPLPSFRYTMRLEKEAIYNLLDPKLTLSIEKLKQQTIHAIAAIGQPERFFNSLRDMGLSIKTYMFRDHHEFTEKDFKRFSAQDLILMTEKDAVKCRAFAYSNIWVLPVRSVINEKFVEDLLGKLSVLLK